MTKPQVILIIGRWRCRCRPRSRHRRRVGAIYEVLRRGRKNLHEFLFPRLPGTKDRSAIVLSQFKTRFHLHSSKSTRLEFRFCSENHSGLHMINSSKSVTSFKIWRRLMYERVYFVYFFMNKIGKKWLMLKVLATGKRAVGAINIVMQKHKDFRNCPPYFSQVLAAIASSQV